MAATDFEIRLNTKDFDRSNQQVIAGFNEMEKSAQNAGSSIDNMGKKIAGAAAAYFSIQQAQQFASKVVEIRGEMQKLDVAFTTMLQGDKQAAAELMSQLTEFASVTPFGLMDAASGAKQLLAYGFDVKNVVKDMEMLGNVAAGVSAPLGDIVYLYGTLQASQRVTTMDIRQFAGRGIPIYRELAEVLGVTQGEINDLVSAGKVGFKDIEKAFQRMTGEGGTFFNLMREQSGTLAGRISNLQDQFDQMFNEIGASNEGVINDAIDGLSWLVEHYEEVGGVLMTLIADYGVYKAALIALNTYTAAAYSFEIAQLQAVIAAKTSELDTDLASAVAKGRLTAQRALEVQTLRAEVQSKIQAAVVTERQAQAELVQAKNKQIIINQNLALSKTRVLQAQQELAAAQASGNATAIENAKTNLNTAIKERNALSRASSINTRRIETATTNAQVAAQARETITTKADTAAKTVQATTTSIVTMATKGLTMATNALTAAMAKNPVGLILVGVTTLIGAFMTFGDEAGEASEEVERFGESAIKTVRNLDTLLAVVNHTNKNSKVHKDTIEEITKIYDEYGIALDHERDLLRQINENREEAIRLIKEEGEERQKANRLAGYQNAINEANKKMRETFLEGYQEAEWDMSGVFDDWDADSFQNMAGEVTQIAASIIESEAEELSKLSGSAYTKAMNALVKQIESAYHNMGLATTRDGYHLDVNIREIADAYISSLRGIYNAKKEYEATLEEPIELVIYAPPGFEETEEGKRYFSPTIAELEEQKKGLEKELKELKEIDALGGMGDDLRKQIAEINERIEQATKGVAKPNIHEQRKLTEEYKRDVVEEVIDAQLEIRQASIDAMDEGFDKENAQLELNYQKQLQEITNMESEMVEALRDYKEKQWELQNPNAKKQGKSFDRSSITSTNLSQDQKDIIKALYEQADADYIRGIAETNKKLLKEWQTYEQQRTAITEKYNKIRADLRKAGATDGQIEEVNYKESEDLSKIDEQFAMRSAEFEAWASTITNISLDNLKKMLAEAESALAEMEKNNPGDPKLALQRATVNRLKKEFEGKQAEDNANPNKRTLEQWKDVQDVIKDSIDVFEELGDAIGGTAGEVISSAMAIASSTLQMVNGIVQLMGSSTDAITGVSQVATQEMSALEKASVILAIISAAMQIAMKIASLFNQDENRQEYIDDLQRKIDNLEFRRTNPEIVNMWTKRGKAAEKVNAIYAKHLDLLIDIAFANSDWKSLANLSMKGLEQGSKNYNKALQEIVKSYADLSYSESSLTTADRYANAGKQLEYIAEQQLLIAEQQRQEEEKKKTDEDKLAEWEQKQEELALEVAKVQAEIIEDILGGSARSIAEQLSDAYWEAAEQGKNAMESWAKEADKIMSDIGKNMLITKWLEPRIGTLIDEVTKDWFDDKGNFQPDKVEESMPKFSKGLEEIGYAYSEVAAMMPDWMKESIDDLAERQSSSRGIATASQESVDENNARLTTIQAHTASIAGNVDEMVKEIREQRLTSLRTAQIADDIRANTIEMIRHLQGIESNTGTTNSKLDKISGTLTDIQLKGVKMK